jgi:probable HAF family extracellular repeat protein
MTDLGTILPGDITFAAAINSKTQVVGTETYPNGAFSAFLWENGSIVDLNTLVTTGSQLTLMFPLDINDRGEIAFNPTDANGNAHAVLLIPCDDDHPNVEGCDYNMVDASTLAARVSPTPEKSSSAPPNYVSPGFGRSGNPMQRRFGGRFGPWNQGMGAERPALKPTSAPPTDGTPEHSPLCSQGSNGQSGAEDAKLPVTDSFTFHGVCHVNYINNLLDGRCVAPVDGEICRYKSDAQQCPAGAKAIRPAWVTISFNCKSVRVDLARPCSFNY